MVNARITAVKSGINVSIDDLSTHHLAGGNVDMIIAALINAQKANIDLTFDQACAIDLATKGTSKNVVEAVHTSVNPQVIDCPPLPAPSVASTPWPKTVLSSRLAPV